MSHVYRLGSHAGTEYVNTRKEADRVRLAGELPETFDRLDAAAECQRLHGELEKMESKLNRARYLLGELYETAPPETRASEDGKRAWSFLGSHPLPPADSADRQPIGQSYGV